MKSSLSNTKRIRKAIKQQHDLHLVYRKANGRTVKRKVTPQKLEKGLLTGYDHKRKDIRSYRVERIKGMKKAAFWNGFEKASELGVHGLELAGLGMLGTNAAHGLKSKNPEERTTAKRELGGLGVLALHPAYSVGKRLLTHGE